MRRDIEKKGRDVMIPQDDKRVGYKLRSPGLANISNTLSLLSS